MHNRRLLSALTAEGSGRSRRPPAGPRRLTAAWWSARGGSIDPPGPAPALRSGAGGGGGLRCRACRLSGPSVAVLFCRRRSTGLIDPYSHSPIIPPDSMPRSSRRPPPRTPVAGGCSGLRFPGDGNDAEPRGLCLPGRSEKIREVVCRFGAHVPIRAVWLARAADWAVRRRPGARVIRGTSASSNRTARSAGSVVNWPRATRDRDRWKRRSERLKKQLDEARRAGRRQAAPFAKDRPQGRGRHPGRRAGARYGRQGCRPRPRQVDEAFAAPGADGVSGLRRRG